MTQLPLFEPPTWSVIDLTRYIGGLLEEDGALQDLWVQGEVSNLSRPASGHLYFTLKDDKASLRCVMWRNSVLRLSYLPRDGDAVEVHGAVSVYPQGGVYQLYADALRPVGEGALYQAFLRLKARLEAEGLFDPARKRAIPAWPRRIGIVTSPTGAALRDMLKTLRRRYPLVEVVLAPSPVQGDEAPPGIVAALQALNARIQPDVILLARGGGAIEDLWAFNDERVARAIAASQAPVISGVGHETDFTIADFVADLRAPTPTAAAELATPDRQELAAALDALYSRLQGSLRTRLAHSRLALEAAAHRLERFTPGSRVRADRQRVDELARRAGAAIGHRIALEGAGLTGLQRRLEALSPQAILQRGYAVIHGPAGQVVRSTRQVQPGDRLRVLVSDGAFDAQVAGNSPPREP
jgi:exodeoxyribonuclease VII large subunit